MANKKPRTSDILNGLAAQASNLPSLKLDNNLVEQAVVAEALKEAATHMRLSVTRLFKWIFYSLGLSLLLLSCAKMFGLLAGTRLTADEFVREMLFHGDLLLISAAFACEAVGILLSSAPGKETLKSAAGFFCLAGLMVSMVVIACCASLPAEPVNPMQLTLSEPLHAESVATTKAIIKYSTIPIFLITITAVSVTKLRKEL